MIGDAHRLVHAIGLRIAEHFGRDLTQAEALVLAALVDESPQTVGALHRAFGHRHSTLTSVLDRLEKKALVRTKRAPADLRSIIVEPTASGQKMAARVRALFAALESEIPKRTCANLQASLPQACDALVDGKRRKLEVDVFRR